MPHFGAFSRHPIFAFSVLLFFLVSAALVAPVSSAKLPNWLKKWRGGKEVSSASAESTMSPTVVHVAGWSDCPYTKRARAVMDGLAVLYPDKLTVELNLIDDREEFRQWLKDNRDAFGEAASSHRTSPFCWKDEGEYIGGSDDAVEWCRDFVASLTPPSASDANAPTPTVALNGAGNGDGQSMVDDGFYGQKPSQHGYDYDLVVIGGGSGGIAMAKKSAKLGAEVCLLDFVKPSWAGTAWGLGGTCVNVGCIPKKLMHLAALHGENIADSVDYGWKTSTKGANDWETLRTNVQRHIKSLNFGYRTQLSKIKNESEGKVDYKNGLAVLKDAHTIEYTNKRGKVSTTTAARILLAVGGRPKPLNCPGGDLAISSDDIFSLENPPGKTCIVGAGYVALECAGFLAALGYKVTLLVRSVLLRGFDRECVEKIKTSLEDLGVDIEMGVLPEGLQKTDDGKITVQTSQGFLSGFDTVLSAIGRASDTTALGIDAVGIELKDGGKVDSRLEQTSVPNIYAIGDCTFESYLELTPVAIQAGELLADRLFGGSSPSSGPFMDYTNVATTVFTPLEYGACGMTEEEAIAKFGDDLEVYHKGFTPLEYTVVEHRAAQQQCFCKVLVQKSTDKIVGMHFCGPHAGEVIQGYAAAVKVGITFASLTTTVGIHPTNSEEFTTIRVTKSSGEDAATTSC